MNERIDQIIGQGIQDMSEEIRKLQKELEAVKRERDEMAAHNEKLMHVSWEMKEGVQDAYYKIKDCRSDTGKSILAKRDLEQQEKGVFKLASYLCAVKGREFNIMEIAVLIASQLRQQASEVSK